MRPLLTEDIDHVLNHGAAALEAFAGKQLLITGGTGFFGSWLIETWIAARKRWGRGGTLTLISRDPAAFLERRPHLRDAEGVCWVREDLLGIGAPQLAGILGGAGSLDAVVHLVTVSDLAALSAARVGSINVIVESTRRALEVARLTGASRFLFTSSGAVYGRQPPGTPHLSETDPLAPDTTDMASAYGVGGNAKRFAELLCAAYAKETPVQAVVARCFTFFGPHLPLDGKFAIGNFLADAVAGGELIIKGDGTPVRSYLYAADLAVWLWTLLAQGAAGRAYNVGSALPITIRELAEAVRLAADPERAVRVLGQRDESRSLDAYVPSTKRAAEELKLRQWISLPEGLERTLRWLRSS